MSSSSTYGGSKNLAEGVTGGDRADQRAGRYAHPPHAGFTAHDTWIARDAVKIGHMI
jgi:hypothetical protein